MSGKDAQRGFTLVEILVAAVIILLIVTTVSGILRNSVSLRERGAEMTEKARIGTALIDIIRRDLNAMSFYPDKKSIYFSLVPESDSGDKRRDSMTFDALVSDITESGIVVRRFGRISYFVEEQFGMPEYKKLIRRTVFINDEYEEKDVAEIIEDEMKKQIDPADEPSEEDAEQEEEEQKVLEKIALEKGLKDTVLSRNITFFRIDVLSEEEGEWEEAELENKVPPALKVSVGMVPKTAQDDEFAVEEHEEEFSSVIRPVIAPYVSNPQIEKYSKKGSPARSMRRRK